MPNFRDTAALLPHLPRSLESCLDTWDLPCSKESWDKPLNLWFYQAVCKVWHSLTISTKAFHQSLCQVLSRVWHLASVSSKALNKWLCQAIFRDWHLVRVSTKALSEWLCQAIFRAWHLVRISTKALREAQVTLPSSLQNLTFGQNFNQRLERVTLPAIFRVWFLARISTKALNWTGYSTKQSSDSGIWSEFQSTPEKSDTAK